MEINLFDPLKKSIIKVLSNDPQTMPLSVLMHKVFMDVKKDLPPLGEKIKVEEFNEALASLMQRKLVGKNKFNKYFIDYLDYKETDICGEGFIEIDEKSGNGFITIKKHKNEYQKSSHFVHSKNLNGASSGDVVRFCELLITDKKQFKKFGLKDAKVKEILIKSSSELEHQ